ncbi:hypothetical protein SBOR_9762 [Sclerotinia borealis F-4128]|uniref:Uncharacterized protein n=1 Tax=Sclerotinia borealis (strain F-4128) TaxID=1432307 RepID=W9C1V4_SCLBF|nr:hypothetical protein SBOR_9762 [Sclerotinia borealis F-4128]
MANQSMIQRGQTSSAANYFINNCPLYDGEKARARTDNPYVAKDLWKIAMSASRELGCRETAMKRERIRIKKQWRDLNSRLDNSDAITKASSSSSSRPQENMLVKRETCRAIYFYASEQTPRIPRSSNSSPQVCEWLSRRFFGRHISDHSGDIRKLNRERSCRIINGPAAMAQTRERVRTLRELMHIEFINRGMLLEHSPLRYHNILITGINKEERYLEYFQGVRVREIKALSGDRTQRGIKMAGYLRKLKDNVHDFCFQKKFTHTVKSKNKKADISAQACRAHMNNIGVWHKTFNELEEKAKRAALNDPRVGHGSNVLCLSAVPWYMEYDFAKDRILGTGLSNSIAAGDWLKKARPNFVFDTDGERSSLRMVVNVGNNFREEYHKASNPSPPFDPSNLWRSGIALSVSPVSQTSGDHTDNEAAVQTSNKVVYASLHSIWDDSDVDASDESDKDEKSKRRRLK